ncbi:hypothetical protein GGF50DRAFT_114958 [Schizophyllum commune]
MSAFRSYIFYGLNVVRALSIVSLLLVFISCIITIVNNVKAVNYYMAHRTKEDEQVDCDYIENSTVPNQAAGVFWAVVSSLLIVFQSVVLIMSELSWPMTFFDTYFPVLGSNFGTGALGIFQCFIGAQILSHHVDDFTLVAAFFLFSVSCLNMILGLIFRASGKHQRSIRAYRNQEPDPFADPKDGRPPFAAASPSYVKSMFTGSTAVAPEKEEKKMEFGEKAGFGFGRQGEKKAGLKGFLLSRPEETLPRYASPVPASAPRIIGFPTQGRTLSPPRKGSIQTTSSFCSPGTRPSSTASSLGPEPTGAERDSQAYSSPSRYSRSVYSRAPSPGPDPRTYEPFPSDLRVPPHFKSSNQAI